MIIWRGYGILVIILTALSYTLTAIGAEFLWGDPLPAEYAPIARMFGMLLAAVLVLVLYLAIDLSDKKRVLVDTNSQTGTQNMILMKSKHDFLFIPLKFWPYILAAIGVLLYLQPWAK